MRCTKQVISSNSRLITRQKIRLKLKARAAIIKSDDTLPTQIQEGLALAPIEFQDRQDRWQDSTRSFKLRRAKSKRASSMQNGVSQVSQGPHMTGSKHSTSMLQRKALISSRTMTLVTQMKLKRLSH